MKTNRPDDNMETTYQSGTTPTSSTKTVNQPIKQTSNQKTNQTINQTSNQKTNQKSMPKSIFDMSTNDSSSLHSTGSMPISRTSGGTKVTESTTTSTTGSTSDVMGSSKTVNSLYSKSQANPILSSGKSEESNFKTNFSRYSSVILRNPPVTSP